MKVQKARDLHWARHSFDPSGYRSSRFRVRVGPLALTFPNPGLLPLHDLHHVATGYASDLLGEAEISAFELRTGGYNAIVFVLCMGAIAIGLFVSPRRILKAFTRAKHARSLYGTEMSYERLLQMELGELRALLNIPPEGYAAR